MASNDKEVREADGEMLQFSLTDPDHLLKQLDSADLNDEETEVLLSEAMKLNAHLKDVLRRQQDERLSSKGRRKHSAYGPNHPFASSMMGPRRRGQSAALPPISYSDKSKDRPKSKTVSDSHRQPSQNPGSDSKVKKITHKTPIFKKSDLLKESASKRKGSGKKTAASRPGWDDRFNFG